MPPRRRPSRTAALLWTGFLSAALIIGVTVVLAGNVTGSVRWRIAQSMNDPDATLFATIDRMVEIYRTANPITIVKKSVTGGSSSSAAKSELYYAMGRELREAKTYFAAAPGHPAAAGYGKTVQELRRLSDIYDSYAISRSSAEYGKILDLMKGIWDAFKASPLDPSFPVKDYALTIEQLLGTGRFQPVTVIPQQTTTTVDPYYTMCVNGCSSMSEGTWKTECYSGCERMRGGSNTYTTTTYTSGYSCSNCDHMSAGADRDRCYAGCSGGSYSAYSAGYMGGSWSSYGTTGGTPRCWFPATWTKNGGPFGGSATCLNTQPPSDCRETESGPYLPSGYTINGAAMSCYTAPSGTTTSTTGTTGTTGMTAQEICYKGCDNMSDSAARNSCRDGCSKMQTSGTSHSYSYSYSYTMPSMTSDAFTMCVSGCKGMTPEQCTSPSEGTKYWCDQKAAESCEKACQAHSGTTGAMGTTPAATSGTQRCWFPATWTKNGSPFGGSATCVNTVPPSDCRETESGPYLPSGYTINGAAMSCYMPFGGKTGSTSGGGSGWSGSMGYTGGMSCSDGCKSMTGVTDEQRQKCIAGCGMTYTGATGNYAESCLQGCKTMSGFTDAERERCAAMCTMTPEQQCQMETGCESVPLGEKRDLCIANCSKSAATYSPGKEGAPSTPWASFSDTFTNAPEWLKAFDAMMYQSPGPLPLAEKPTPAKTDAQKEFADMGSEEFQIMLEEMRKRWEILPPPPMEGGPPSLQSQKPERSPEQDPSLITPKKPEQDAVQIEQEVRLTLEEKFLGEQKHQEHQELLSTMIASYQRMSSIHELHVLPKAAQQSVAQGLGTVTGLFSEAAGANLTIGEIGALSASLTETLATVDTAIEKAAKDVAKKGLPYSLSELIEKKGILSVYRKLQDIIDTIPSAFTIFKSHKIPVPATVMSAHRDAKALLAYAKPECEKATAKCIAAMQRVIDKLEQGVKQPMDRILGAVNKPEVSEKVDKLFVEE